MNGGSLGYSERQQRGGVSIGRRSQEIASKYSSIVVRTSSRADHSIPAPAHHSSVDHVAQHFSFRFTKVRTYFRVDLTRIFASKSNFPDHSSTLTNSRHVFISFTVPPATSRPWTMYGPTLIRTERTRVISVTMTESLWTKTTNLTR